MAEYFWYFIAYSFLGYLLEKGFAAATHAENQTRKCFLLLPLCPVYGLGMLAVLALPEPLLDWPLVLLTGAAAVTAVEYVVHWAYETFLGVRFWDYSAVSGDVNGRICLPFTLAWSPLTAAAVFWVQPGLEWAAAQIPPAVTYAALLLLTVDAVCSARFLQVTGDIEGLRSIRPGRTA